MTTPKSKKPSPLIATNSPKVALWHLCKKCSSYLNQKDNGLHTCQDLNQTKHPFIRDNSVFSFVETTEGIDNQSINVDNLVLLSLSAIQLCKFQIGEPVHLSDVNLKRHVAKTVWPTSSKSLLSVQVSNNVLQNDLKMSVGDPIQVCQLSQIPEPLLEVSLHCSVEVDQYETKSLLTCVASQLRTKLIHCNQMLNIVFYGVVLGFTVQKVVLFPKTTHGNTPSSNESLLDTIDKDLQSLHLSSKHKGKDPIVFYKILDSTKFIITNCNKKLAESVQDSVVYKLEDLGGVDQVVDHLTNIMNMALGKSASIQGMKKSTGILIHGVNGTGKTSLIHSMASHMNVFSTQILVADLFSKFYGEAESRLKTAFDLALDHAPSILLLDNLDVLCSGKSRSDQERRLVSCLVTQMDRLHELQASVVLLAVTTSLDNVDVQLRTPGRLDQEIELTVPTREQRAAILTRLLSKMSHTLSPDEIESVAFVTHGFVAADLAALVSSAATAALLADEDGTKSGSPGTRLSCEQVMRALERVKPSAMRQVLVEVPNVRWTDIGGQEEVKLKLRQSVEWPLKHPEAFARLGIAPPRGILMFGPPGCSKTMIAKALATESKLNFISVKGPELFRKYVGESERCVRDVFKRARQVSPSVIFFDELDALAGERGDGGGGGGSSVQERVLAQMLTEMDGIVPLNNVTIVAATNRPDRIDKALLRPGRLDRLIYVPLPDDDTRAAILKLRLRRSPVSGDVREQELVKLTRGYSGAEIVAVCDEAALLALENDLEAACVCQKDFDVALQLVKPRTPAQLIKLYENYIKK